jgi:ammonia channel protein AmtB
MKFTALLLFSLLWLVFVYVPIGRIPTFPVKGKTPVVKNSPHR